MSDALTLSEVLARDVAVEWPEAVAVVRGVAGALLENPESARLLPELHQIQISSSGRVDVTGGTVVQEPVRRLGQLLQATLGQSEPPVQLRLLISQATAPTPAYGSILQYDEALAYFERPGRSAVLQALHTRASQASVVSRIEGVPTLDTIAPLPAQEASKNAGMKQLARPQARTVDLLGTGAVLVLLCIAGVRYVRVGALPETSHKLSAKAAHGLDLVGGALVSGLSSVTERVGLGRLVSTDAVAAKQLEADARSASNAPKTERTRPVPAEAQRVDVARIVTPHGPASEPALASAASAGKASGVAETATVGLPARVAPFAAFDLEPATEPVSPLLVVESRLLNRPVGQEDATRDERAIYSPLSEGVSSPVALRPQLPQTLPPNVRRSDLRLIELVISPVGSVESVKLVGTPRNVHDSMLLSAVKAWEFKPAVKDGVPVRYRKTVWIAPSN